MTKHTRALIEVMLAADEAEKQAIWSPLVAAAGQVAKLPPELQPYHLHMKASLAIR
jgi:hypothetical protein